LFVLLRENSLAKMSEWVSDYFSAISWREQVNLQCDDDGVPLCIRPTRLVVFL
jgi:hypothetical protein